MRRPMDKTEQEVVFQYFLKHNMLEAGDYVKQYWISDDARLLPPDYSSRDYTLEVKHIKGLVMHIEGKEL